MSSALIPQVRLIPKSEVSSCGSLPSHIFPLTFVFCGIVLDALKSGRSSLIWLLSPKRAHFVLATIFWPLKKKEFVIAKIPTIIVSAASMLRLLRFYSMKRKLRFSIVRVVINPETSARFMKLLWLAYFSPSC